jgi:hypothetical protein
MPVPSVAFCIAPINAIIYGTAGASVGWIFFRFIAKFRRRVKANQPDQPTSPKISGTHRLLRNFEDGVGIPGVCSESRNPQR